MWLQSVHKIMSKLHLLQYKGNDVGSGRGPDIPHPEVCCMLKILQQYYFQDDKFLLPQGRPLQGSWLSDLGWYIQQNPCKMKPYFALFDCKIYCKDVQACTDNDTKEETMMMCSTQSVYSTITAQT